MSLNKFTQVNFGEARLLMRVPNSGVTKSLVHVLSHCNARVGGQDSLLCKVEEILKKVLGRLNEKIVVD